MNILTAWNFCNEAKAPHEQQQATKTAKMSYAGRYDIEWCISDYMDLKVNMQRVRCRCW